MLDAETFERVVSSTPLISVDLIVKKEAKVLLGKRTNRPAQGYWFTIGGRIYKDEKISEGIKRVAKEELNLALEQEPKFLGVYEHFYDDSIFDKTSTHYVNLGFEIEVKELLNLPKEQHTKYKWFSLDRLLKDKDVHKYVKAYFSGTQFAGKSNNL
jgi:colanic acid biosynthesis protein WcaH